MRIFNGMRDVRQRHPARKEAAEMQRTEIISDIFNNQAETDQEEGPVKVRLSHASRRLMHGLRQELAEFFKAEPKVAERVDAIEIPEEDWIRGDLTLRKLTSYLRWIERQGGSETEPLEGEAPYRALQELGKDEDLKGIFERNLEKAREIRVDRSKNVPNYYYLVYPETYSFN